MQQQNQRQIQAWYLQVLWVLGARFITTGALWWWGRLVGVPAVLHWLAPNIFPNNLNKNNASGRHADAHRQCEHIHTHTHTHTSLEIEERPKGYPSSSFSPQSHPSLLCSSLNLASHTTISGLRHPPHPTSNLFCVTSHRQYQYSRTQAPNWVGYGSRVPPSCSQHQYEIRQYMNTGWSVPLGVKRWGGKLRITEFMMLWGAVGDVL